MNNKATKTVSLLVAAASIAILPQSAKAAVVFQEDFDYNTDELGSQGGWTSAAANTDLVPGLSYGLDSGLGKALQLSGSDNANAASHAISPAISGTFYVSALFKFEGAVGQNDFAAAWFNTSGGLGFGLKGNADTSNPSNPDLFARLSIADAAYGQNITPGETYLLVAKYQHTGSSYTGVTLWINPTGEQSASASDSGSVNTTISSITFRTANLDLGDLATFDRLRIGTTWADVTTGVIPEPTTLIAGALLLIPFTLSGFRLIRKRD